MSRRAHQVIDRLIRTRVDATTREFEHELLRALTNDGDGWLVIWRHRHLSGSTAFECVTTDMGRIWMLRSDSVILPILRTHGTWEPAEQEFLRRHLAPGSTVVNVGANVGYTALALSSIVGPSGQVVALEPEPLNHRLLCVNTAGVGNILPIHAAAGDLTGTIELQRSATNTGDHRTAPHEDDIGGVTVPMVRLDDLCGDTRVDAIVSDTQGFDHRVIAGARAVITRCRPLLTVEFWPFGIRNLGDDPIAVIDAYRDLDYASIVKVPTGEDLTRRSSEEILERSISEFDHTTLALLPN